MTRVEEPYDSKKHVTEEEVQRVLDKEKFLNGVEYVYECEELIERMWQEIQDLRSILQKQIY